ncbi:MAG: MFS transporter [Desulfocapsaceae bacterium]|nr:MFS transporter [Desulfocapsaceae bacterium]
MTTGQDSVTNLEQKLPDSFYWSMLIGMQLCVFMCTFDSGVVNLALPVIRKQLHLTLAEVKWVAICYTATAALTLPVSAWLGRRFGIRRMFLFGVALFTLASGSCGLSWNLPSLIALRIAAAMGASLILSLNKVIVLRVFPRSMHGRALGVAGTTFALGILCGLGAGGILIHLWSWRSIFLISFPIGLIALPWNFIMTKRSGIQRDANIALAFDWQGMLWMAAGFGALVWIVNHWLSKSNNSLFLSLSTTLIGMIMIVGWLRHEFCHEESFLHLRLLRISPLGYNFMNGFSVRVLMGITNFIIPFYLQTVLMLTPAKAGLVLAAGAISMGIIGPFAGAMSDRRGMQKTIALGLVLMTLGIAGFIVLPSSIENPAIYTRYIIGIIVLQVLIGCGSTFFSAANTNSSLHSITRDHQASIAGLLSVNLMAGSAIGTTLAGEFFNLIGGVKHIKDAAAQTTSLVFPPHAFAWLFGTCTVWLIILTLYATIRRETTVPITNLSGELS